MPRSDDTTGGARRSQSQLTVLFECLGDAAQTRLED